MLHFQSDISKVILSKNRARLCTVQCAHFKAMEGAALICVECVKGGPTHTHNTPPSAHNNSRSVCALCLVVHTVSEKDGGSPTFSDTVSKNTYGIGYDSCAKMLLLLALELEERRFYGEMSRTRPFILTTNKKANRS